MLRAGRKSSFSPTETNKLKEIAAVYFVEDISVGLKEEEDKILDHMYNKSIAYSFTTHQIEDLIQDAGYHESWITSKNSSLEAQYSYQKTSSLCTNHTSLIGEAQTTHYQTEMQPCLPPPTTLSFQSPLGAQDLLEIGAQFYGQIDHSQMEHTTREQRRLASSKVGADTQQFGETESYDYVLFDLQEQKESCQEEEIWELVKLEERKL